MTTPFRLDSLRTGFVSLALFTAQSHLLAQPPQFPGQPAPPQEYSQPAGEGQEAEDVPGRGVARLSLVNGDVSVKRGDSGEMVAAAVNAPLVASDRIFTGTGARAELQLDSRNRIRIAGDADIHLAEIEPRHYAVELGRGTITWHVIQGFTVEIDINTPSVSIRPIQPGDYRVTVNDDGTTSVTARTGEAEIYSPRGVERIRRGRTTLIRGERTDPEFQTIAELNVDDWDHFNIDRDRETDRSESAQYLPEGIMGAEELDQNGSWVDAAPYGRVWQPRVAADWSPYSQGRWAWTDYYGWSWVSYDQFGWAPFHYGSWFNAGGRWSWYPGARQVRTFWRPAMVAWFGFGNGHVSAGFGNWGWVPLAPFERFHPWYGRGYYGNNRTNIHANIRILNNYNIVNNYRNARVNGGARSIDAAQFGRAGANRYERVGESNLRSAGLMQGQLPATPSRESLSFNDRRTGHAGQRSRYDGAFYNRRPAVAQERIPFVEQQRGIERTASVFNGDNGLRGSGRNGMVAGPGPDSNQRVIDNGWRRLGERPASDNGMRGNSGNNSGAVRNDPAGQRNDGNGWRRFGEPPAPDNSHNSLRSNPATGRAGAGRELDPSVRGGNQRSDGNGWRRFGEPAAPEANTPRVSDGMRGGRMDDGGQVDSGSRGFRPRTESVPDPNVRQMRTVETDRPVPPPNSNWNNRQDLIRLNPPVLRDRSDSGSRGGARTQESAPQYRAQPTYGPPLVRENGAGSMRGSQPNSGSAGMGGGSRGGETSGNAGHPNGSRSTDGSSNRSGGGRRSN